MVELNTSSRQLFQELNILTLPALFILESATVIRLKPDYFTITPSSFLLQTSLQRPTCSQSNSRQPNLNLIGLTVNSNFKCEKLGL